MIEKTSSDIKKNEQFRIKSRRKSSSVSQSKGTFENTLNEVNDFKLQGTLEELMNDLRDQERKFLDKQTLHELNRYKAIIKKILSLILEEGMHTKTLKRARKDRAAFTIVGEIDAKLISLQEAITRHNKAFNLFKTIEEIRGLILDLNF